MKRWEITACAPEHIAALERRNGTSLDLIRDVLEVAREELAVQARTIWHDEHPIAAWGVAKTTMPGVYEAWALLTEPAVHLPIALTRQVRDSIEEAWKTLPIRRLEAYVPKDDWIAYRWLGVLGFRDELLMHAYALDGSDVVLFAQWKGM